MKKVIIITYYWPPAGGAPVQRWLKLTKYLHQNNIEPIIVTVDESFGGYPISDTTLNSEVLQNQRVYKTKTWEPFEIYQRLTGKKKLPAHSFIDDRKPSFTEKMMRFIRGNLFIPDARVGWNSYAFKQCCTIIDNEKIDAIITTSPPHSSQLIGLKLKKKYNIPWIADFRDPWTDIHFYSLLYHTSIAKRIDLGYERNVIANANKILVVSNGMAKLFKNKYPDCANKLDVIENGFDPDDFELPSNPSKDTFIISHTGSVSEQYNIEEFVCALGNVIKQHPDIPIKFKFVGIISKGIIELFKKYEIEHIIETINYVPHKEVAEILKSSTILFMPIIPSPNKEIVSAKVFEYLASRKPILCIAHTDCDVAEIIEKCNSGKTIDYKDTLKFEDYLNSLLILWKSGKNLNITNDEYLLYSRKNQAKTIGQLINSIL